MITLPSTPSAIKGSILLISSCLLLMILAVPTHASCGIFGCVAPPPVTGTFTPLQAGGLTGFISTLIKLFFAIAGLFVLINIILAGYQFISAGGNPQNISGAWARIYQSFIGLIIIASALLLTSIISWVVFGSATYILNPTIYGPTP